MIDSFFYLTSNLSFLGYILLIEWLRTNGFTNFACGLSFSFFPLICFFFSMNAKNRYKFLCCGLGITGDIKDCVYIFNANFHYYTVRPLR